MKVSRSFTTKFFGLLICFALFLAPSSAQPNLRPSGQNSNERKVPDAPTIYGQAPLSFDAYKLTKQWKEADNSYHYTASYTGLLENFGNSKIIKNIHLSIAFHNKDTFRIKIVDADNKRWEIPEAYPFVETKSENLIPIEQGNCEVHVTEEPFHFYVNRKDTGDIIFDTRGTYLIYSNYYIQLSTLLPSRIVYGIGERNYKFKLESGTYTIWGRDDPMILEDGTTGHNTYSHHPVALIRDQSKNFFITYMKNSNAMDVVIDNHDYLTYKMVGGVIDINFFIGDNQPETALVNYHTYLGKFTMMPFWSMGFHQSKWGYRTSGDLRDVVEKYDKNDIPLDVIWNDIDYMVEKEDFTIDKNNFRPNEIKELMTKYKKKWVPIIDAGIRNTYTVGPAAKTGLERDVFVKNHNGQNLVGSVWPGPVYFPDFFNNKTEQWWCDMMQYFYDTTPFSGIWLDMNEIANFVDGENNRWDSNEYDNIPYTPGGRPLKRKTVSLDAKHAGGYVDYDTHSLFAIQENAATYKFLKSKSKLPFILTRSASVGLGKYSAHWTGDNGADWEHLQISIPGNFNFAIWGIPFVGADICGFMRATTAELCARWNQIGALYPFARNHHELDTRRQEPWQFDANRENNHGISVMTTARVSIKFRYAILKWYYSLFIQTNGVGSVFRPLQFEFPAEEELFSDKYSDWEFLLGSGLLATPQTHPGKMSVEAYFPIATWFDVFTGKEIISKYATTNRVLKVQTPFDTPVPMFLRAGHIIHKQDVTKVLTTDDLNDELEFVVGFDRNELNELEAKGSFMGISKFSDDNVNDRCMEDNCLYDINIKSAGSFESTYSFEVSFTAQKKNTKVPLDEIGVKGFKFYGLPVEFIDEDEKKISYAMMTVTSGLDGSVTIPDILKVEVGEKGALILNFSEAHRVSDGSKFTFELVV